MQIFQIKFSVKARAGKKMKKASFPLSISFVSTAADVIKNKGIKRQLGSKSKSKNLTLLLI